MSNFYSPSMGLAPETREQMLIRMHQHLQTEGIYPGDYHAFLGSNWHRFLSTSVLPMLEEQQAKFAEGQAKLFTFWQEHHMAIQGGMGASYEGVAGVFASHCVGLHIVSVDDDPRLMSAGNMSLYFDELSPDESLRRDLFRLAMPIAIHTPLGDESIEVDFSGANAKVYKFFNLRSSDYTPLDLRVYVSYKSGTIGYDIDRIRSSIRSEFERTNRIGRGFYSQAYFDHSHLPNLASMHITHSVEGSTEFVEGYLAADLGQKYILRNIEVITNE